jgi:FixJ family two-component response regulator
MNQPAEFHTKSNKEKHVFLIDDDDSMRTSIATLLRFVGYQVHDFASARDFLLSEVHVAPAVIITDMRMPDLTGVELQSELQSRGRRIPMIFISGESTTHQVIKAMKGGAIEFLLKPFERERLLLAVAEGLEQDARFMRNYMEVTTLQARLKSLTPRELEVFNLLSLGYNNTQIRESLQISLPTAKQYKSAVMDKLKVSSLAELLALKNTQKSLNSPT